MQATVIEWVEELRGRTPLQAAEAILSALGTTRQRDLRTLAYALTLRHACQRGSQARAITRAQRPAVMNEIYVICPYKHHGMWVFDDARVGVVQEPFVSGADT
jgi:hypothetical protein